MKYKLTVERVTAADPWYQEDFVVCHNSQTLLDFTPDPNSFTFFLFWKNLPTITWIPFVFAYSIISARSSLPSTAVGFWPLKVPFFQSILSPWKNVCKTKSMSYIYGFFPVWYQIKGSMKSEMSFTSIITAVEKRVHSFLVQCVVSAMLFHFFQFITRSELLKQTLLAGTSLQIIQPQISWRQARSARGFRWSLSSYSCIYEIAITGPYHDHHFYIRFS